MKVWKQLVLAIILLAVASAAWVFFFPGAQDILARAGITAAPAVETTGATGTQRQNGQRQGGQQGEVIAAPITRATINDRLQAIGTGQANASVVVNPFDSGRIAEVAVTAGQQVKAGDILVSLDSDVQEIALDRAKVGVTDAQSRFDRVQTLRNARTATEVQVADARVVLSNAQLAQRDAELALERRAVRSPISGIVGILPVELGDYVTSQTAIATIDDRSRIIVDFWVPERFASQITVGQPVEASPVARPGDVLAGSITAVDNRLDQASRTMQVQASIPNTEDRLRAGMSFQVAMKFPGDSYPAVDPLAIQWGGDGAFVWQVKDGKAVRTPVRIIQRNTETVLVEGDLPEGQMVVTQGIHLVRDGGEVRVASRRDSAAPAALPVAGG
jgi:RND family efflux transporter MFP subunit